MDSDDAYEKIVEGWERTETNTGVPYYICHKMERTTWQHPFLQKIMEELADYSDIRYAAYRTAFKVRHLQKKLKLYHVRLSAVKDTFDHYGYPDGTNSVIGCTDLLHLFYNLYLQADQSAISSDEEAEIYAELLQNFMLSLFDVNRTGCVPILAVKIMLIVLCAARLAEKYKAFYQELTDPSTYISNKNFTSFMESIVQLPDLLQEGAAFGRDVTPAVTSCMQMCSGTVGISEDMFYVWLLKEPQTIVWLPTFHRVAASETVKHESKCNICKVCPIVGFRYRCLQCFNFDMCQSCFYTGRTKKKHKLKHPIQEYCLATTAKVDTKAFMKTLKNNLSKKHRKKSKLKYLPIVAENKFNPNTWDCVCLSFTDHAIDNSEALFPFVPKHIFRIKKASRLLRSMRIEPPVPDVHKTLSENAHRLADLEYHAKEDSNHDNRQSFTSDGADSENKENQAVTVTIEKTTIDNNSPAKSDDKEEALVKQRKELEKVIQELEEENRQLHQQLAEMQESSDTESNFSGPDIHVITDQKRSRHHNHHAKRPLASIENIRPLHVDTQYQFPGKNSVHLSPKGPAFLSPNHGHKLSPHHVGPLSPVYPPKLSPRHTNSRSPSPRHVNSLSPVCSIDSDVNGYSYKLSPNSGYVYSSRYLTNKTSTSSLKYSPQNASQSFLKESISPVSFNKTSTPYDSLDCLEASPSHFTLPSYANSRVFTEEEDEMDLLVQKMEQVFPSNMSYSAYSMSTTGDEMLQAASTIGTAMSEFVSEAILPQERF